MGNTTTVRISDVAHEHLRELSASSGRPLQAVLETAIEALRRDSFFACLDAAYESLWADDHAAAEERSERRLWDDTLADGPAD